MTSQSDILFQEKNVDLVSPFQHVNTPVFSSIEEDETRLQVGQNSCHLIIIYRRSFFSLTSRPFEKMRIEFADQFMRSQQLLRWESLPAPENLNECCTVEALTPVYEYHAGDR